LFSTFDQQMKSYSRYALPTSLIDHYMIERNMQTLSFYLGPVIPFLFPKSGSIARYSLYFGSQRYNPELQRKSLENRDRREQEFDEYVNKLKEWSKSDKSSMLTLTSQLHFNAWSIGNSRPWKLFPPSSLVSDGTCLRTRINHSYSLVCSQRISGEEARGDKCTDSPSERRK
jgi:CBP4